jgi:hypothetical protein
MLLTDGAGDGAGGAGAGGGMAEGAEVWGIIGGPRIPSCAQA